MAVFTSFPRHGACSVMDTGWWEPNNMPFCTGEDGTLRIDYGCWKDSWPQSSNPVRQYGIGRG